MDVFILWHIHELKDDFGAHDEEKLIGVFSSEAKARQTIALLKDRAGFRSFPSDCFEVHRTTLDQANWLDGFYTVRWRGSSEEDL